MDLKKFTELANKHLTALESYKMDKNGNTKIQIFGIEALYKAINYTPCCTELKDEEKLNFEKWLKKEKIIEVKEVYYKCCGIDLSKELVDKAFKNRNL